MKRKRNFARGSSFYHRDRAALHSGSVFLIVTEGEKTEPNYFLALRHRLQLMAADLEIIHPDCTDPVNLVEKAIELRDKRKQEAKKGFSVAYDEVWVVFDLEEPKSERRELAKIALVKANKASIQVADSDPCFEFWLLLHGEFTTSPFPRCESIVGRLNKYWKNYKKSSALPEKFLELLSSAVKNANRCRVHHQKCKGDGNPSTNVDLLVKKLNFATRPHLRFNLGWNSP